MFNLHLTLLMMASPQHILVFNETGDFQAAIEFTLNMHFSAYQGQIGGKPSIELYDCSHYATLLQWCRLRGLQFKLYSTVHYFFVFFLGRVIMLAA